jgi:hypothetical protein
MNQPKKLTRKAAPLDPEPKGRPKLNIQNYSWGEEGAKIWWVRSVLSCLVTHIRAPSRIYINLPGVGSLSEESIQMVSAACPRLLQLKGHNTRHECRSTPKSPCSLQS